MFITQIKEKLRQFKSTKSFSELNQFIEELEKKALVEKLNEGENFQDDPTIFLYTKGLLKGLYISESINDDDFWDLNDFIDELISKHYDCNVQFRSKKDETC